MGLLVLDNVVDAERQHQMEPELLEVQAKRRGEKKMSYFFRILVFLIS